MARLIFCVGTERDLFAMLRRVGSLEDEAIPIPMMRLEWMAGIFPSCQESCFPGRPEAKGLVATPLEVLNQYRMTIAASVAINARNR